MNNEPVIQMDVATVTLTEDVFERAEHEAQASGYGTLGDFFSDLVDAHIIKRSTYATEAELDVLLAESLNDPRPARPADEVIAEIRSKMKRRFGTA